ncbi:MAG: Flp pilus assembly protein CpaB [Candidatus Anammoximicrobium sp.]|nr:Flp pilus assembly protein CpaB [Candidatus Anammoximicrobium sp.]
MSARTIAVVFLALLCGASLAIGVMRANPGNAKGRVPMEATVPVVVAAADIARGKMVVAQDLALREWPKDLAPPGALSEVQAAVERAAIGQLVPGEPVLESKLAPRNAGRGLAALIPEGMRAYTIQTSRVASNVAGFILPGNKVDVLLNLKGTNRGEDRTGGGSTTTLLQAVEVLAVDQILESPEENKVDPKQSSSVTLLVTPDQAAKLDLGQNMGILTLSLRNPDDSAPADTEPATITQIRYLQGLPKDVPDGEPRRPPEPLATVPEISRTAEPPRPKWIVCLRGSHRGRVSVSGGSDEPEPGKAEP